MVFQTMTTIPDALQSISPIKQDIVVASTEVAPSLSSASSEVHSDDDAAQISQDDDIQQTGFTDIATPGMHDAIFGPTALKVLQILETYGSQYGRSDATWSGLNAYLPLVGRHMRAGQPIQLLFSGFPFKEQLASGHVLSQTPDLGEQLALEHLNGICSNIAAIYDKGAKIYICSNGLMYNDLLEVSDDLVRSYETELRVLAKERDLQHLNFVELSEVLQHEVGDFVKDQSSLQARSAAYALALSTNKADFIQLECENVSTSIRSDALTISFLSQSKDNESLSPWQSCIAIELDGSYRCAHADELRNDEAYELVLGQNGAPSHYRAKSDIWNWKSYSFDVEFEHLYPTGVIIRPRCSSSSEAPSMLALPMKKVRFMSQRFSPIVLRGFKDTTEEEHFLAKGNELGEILTWTFGQILKVKDSGEVDRNANNVTSNEAMPMHFDGVFKFVDKLDPETGAVTKVLTPPRYQYFTCLSTAPKGDGYTLFADSRLFFQHLPSPFSLSHLEKSTWSMVNDGFWSAKQTGLPLVVKHKETGAACLRWHQPWTKTKFSKYFIEIENEESGEELVQVINTLLYDYRICLRFEWEQGDLLINDNVSMLHTRTAFVGNCEREMWRIHFD